MIQSNPKAIRRVFVQGKSLWRAYLNAAAESLTLESPILDLGAGELGTASYHGIIPGFQQAQVTSIDIDADKSPTHTVDLEAGLPVDSNAFASCVAFNLFEHLYQHESVLAEIFRVLRPNGTLALAVPFLARVHGDPSDFWRYTGYALERRLRDAGFDRIQVTACGGGALTAALAMIEFAVPGVLRGISLRLAWWLDQRISARSGGKYRNAQDYPLGYLVTARKPEMPA
jgi:SAM-dependent methyltransferase